MLFTTIRCVIKYWNNISFKNKHVNITKQNNSCSLSPHCDKQPIDGLVFINKQLILVLINAHRVNLPIL